MTLLAEQVHHNNDELTVVNAARVSFDKQHDYDVGVEGLIDEDVRLVKYLASHAHWTPFSHARFTFKGSMPILFDIPAPQEDRAGMAVMQDLCKVRHSLYGWVNLLNKDCIEPAYRNGIIKQLFDFMPVSMTAFGFINPQYRMGDLEPRMVMQKDEHHPNFIDCTIRETIPIFVARQRFKHMVDNTYNEVSRRYVSDEPAYYFPDRWRGKPVGGVKQGSHGELPDVDQKWCDSDLKQHHERSTDLYNILLRRGVAPEQARMVLPQTMVTSYWVTSSMTGWARAYNQRKDNHAQKEIRDLAAQWNDIMLPMFGIAWEGMTL